jgi:alpha-L-rhamnosidase
MKPADSNLSVVDLRTEYRPNPLGIASRKPRFSWRLSCERRGARQTAYRILVASSPELLGGHGADRWDSGWIRSPESVAVAYRGKPLAGSERCHWKVFVRDETGTETPSTESAWFETVLDEKEWKARWIGWTAGWNGKALTFRRSFKLDRKIVRARVHLAGLGYYELSVNGARIGAQVLDPAWTAYDKRVLYATFDLTDSLVIGENVIGVLVGNGWHGVPKLIAQFMLWDEAGHCEVIATGTDPVFQQPRWMVAPSPIVSNSVYDGETYDARLEVPGWNAPGFTPPTATEPSAWRLMGAMPVDGPAGRLLPQDMEPIQIVGSLPSVSIAEITPGVHVFDFGQNIAGWCALQVSGKSGDVVVMRFAEILKEDGSIDQSNLRTALAMDTYILKGGAPETWEPRFTYHGFRYVQVEGLPSAPSQATLVAKIVRSAVEPSGEFSCSHPLINQINANARWTEGSNLHGLPTDCPQRDERMGWLNDLTVRAEAAVRHFHLPRLYAKFMDDITDTQDATGAIADTAPFKWGNRPADPVDVSYALLPWILYTHYGDARALEAHYPHLQAWFDCLERLSKKDLLAHSCYGDWAPPVSEGKNGGALPANTPPALMSTGYFLYLARILSKIANVLGKKGDARRYLAREAELTRAFHLAFWDEAKGVYGSGNQASNIFPLWLEIAPPDRRQRAFDSLIADLQAHALHVSTGNLCTRYLFEVLSREGRSDLAVDILSQTTYPSYGYMIENGATTIWERWELGGSGMNSYNHPMYGSVAIWMHRDLAGLGLDETAAGFARAVIRPHVPPQIDHARASLLTMRGLVSVSWKKEAGALHLELTVPPNMEAQFTTPAEYSGAITEDGILIDPDQATSLGIRAIPSTSPGRHFNLVSGRYRFIAHATPS